VSTGHENKLVDYLPGETSSGYSSCSSRQHSRWTQAAVDTHGLVEPVRWSLCCVLKPNPTSLTALP